MDLRSSIQYTESLDWIVDKHGAKLGDEAAYRENIDFVHSLGLKCDCVGWSKLDLASPRTEEILTAIARFCRENGWSARDVYTRIFVGESDWYEIRFARAKEEFSQYNDFREVPDGVVFAVCPDGDRVLLCADGRVIRFSHEAPEEIDTWPGLAQFIVDAVTGNG